MSCNDIYFIFPNKSFFCCCTQLFHFVLAASSCGGVHMKMILWATAHQILKMIQKKKGASINMFSRYV